MNLPNFKDILQKLSVFKDNLSLLIPVIIGLIAILLVIPTQLMSSRLKKQIENQSITNGANKVKRLSENSISNEQLEIEQQSLDANLRDVNEITLLALQTTQRQLLSYDVFMLDPNDPNSNFSRLTFQQFGQKYRKGIDEMINKANARDCPTQDELEMAIEESGASALIKKEAASRYNEYDSLSNLRSTGSRKDDFTSMIYDQICLQRTELLSTYINPIDVSGYEYWSEYEYEQKEEAIEKCWYSQLAYWIIEDIFDTIISMNSGYENVLTAPVKRLMYISFTLDLNRSRTRVRSSSTTSLIKNKDENLDLPTYILSDKDGLTESYTGRYSGENIDVTQFKVKFVIKTEALLPFIQELYKEKEHIYIDETDGTQHIFKHNQITILESNIKFAELESSDHIYYRYGDDSVIELELTCEYIFNKAGYENIKPESVKLMLLEEEEEY